MTGEAETRSDATGRYRFDGIAADAHRLRIAADDRTGVSIEHVLRDSDTTIDLVLLRTGAIDGVTHTPDAHMAYASRTDDEASGYPSAVWAVIDATGAFHFERLPSGTYEVRIGRGESTTITVVAGQRARWSAPVTGP
jgi:hypothetical protein